MPDDDHDSRALLRGLRVLQVDEHITTAFAGHLLRLLGAEVAFLQRDRAAFEGGDDFYEALRFGKAAAGSADGFDLAIAGPAAEVDVSALAQRLPTAEARCFDDVELDGRPASELTLLAASGWLSVRGDSTNDYAPLRPAGFQASLQCGVLLAALGLAAYRYSMRRLSPTHIVLSMREFIASLINTIPFVSYSGQPISRRGVTTAQPDVILPCADGFVYVSAVEESQWHALREIMGDPDWAHSPAFAGRMDRYENYPALHALLAEWTREKTRGEIYLACAEAGDLPQFRERGSLGERITIGDAAVRLPRLPWLYRASGGASVTRASAQIAACGAPLDDVRVVDMSWVWAGPYAGELLAFLGAKVTKVESRGRVDLFRRAGPTTGPLAFNVSASFNQLNQGKRSIALDLAAPDHADAMDALIRRADVFVSNFRPGVLDRLGITQKLEEAGGIVEAALSGYGATPPWGQFPMYGKGAVAISGLASANGSPGGPPQELGFAYGDPCSANFGALGIVACLVQRDRTHVGARLDVSIAESVLCSSTDLAIQQQRTGAVPLLGNRHPVASPQGVFACRDGEYLAISVLTEAQWLSLAAAVAGLAPYRHMNLRSRRHHEAAIEARIAAWVTGQVCDQAAAYLADQGIPAFTVMEVPALLADAGLRRSGFLHESDHPAAGKHTLMGIPWTVDGERATPSPAPLLDGDREVVLAELAAATGGEA